MQFVAHCCVHYFLIYFILESSGGFFIIIIPWLYIFFSLSPFLTGFGVFGWLVAEFRVFFVTWVTWVAV